MKKLFALLVAATMLCAPALFGCAGGEPEEPETPEEPTLIEGYTVAAPEDVNNFQEGTVRTFGRTYKLSNKLCLENAATGLEITFYGTSLTVHTVPSTTYLYMRYFVDDDQEGTLTAVKGKDYEMAKDLAEGVHTVRIVKATSSQNGVIRVTSVETDGSFLCPKESDALRIEFVGDSITVGAGVFGKADDKCTVDNSDATRSYAYRTAAALGAQSTCSFVATEGICVKAKSALQVNMLEMYARRSSVGSVAFTDKTKYDIVVVALGTNDSYYMQSDPTYTQEQFTADYAELLALIRKRNPSAKIVCIYGLMEKNSHIEQGIKAAIETSGENISYLEVPRDNTGAQIHPSDAGAVKQSEVLTEYLRSLL